METIHIQENFNEAIINIKQIMQITAVTPH